MRKDRIKRTDPRFRGKQPRRRGVIYGDGRDEEGSRGQ